MKFEIEVETDINTAITKLIHDELGEDAPVQIQGNDSHFVIEMTDVAGEDPTDEQSLAIMEGLEVTMSSRNLVAKISKMNGKQVSIDDVSNKGNRTA